MNTAKQNLEILLNLNCCNNKQRLITTDKNSNTYYLPTKLKIIIKPNNFSCRMTPMKTLETNYGIQSNKAICFFTIVPN